MHLADNLIPGVRITTNKKEKSRYLSIQYIYIHNYITGKSFLLKFIKNNHTHSKILFYSYFKFHIKKSSESQLCYLVVRVDFIHKQVLSFLCNGHKMCVIGCYSIIFGCKKKPNNEKFLQKHRRMAQKVGGKKVYFCLIAYLCISFLKQIFNEAEKNKIKFFN